MQETPPSNLRIYFGLGGDESLYQVRDIIVHFMMEFKPPLKGRLHWIEKGYKEIKAFYDCKGLHIIGKGGPKIDGEIFYPTTAIQSVAIDWMEDYKEDKA